MPGGGSVESCESSRVMRFFAGGAKVPEFMMMFVGKGSKLCASVM